MLPGPIMVSEPGSFAEQTIVARKPEIIANVLRTNDYSPAIVNALMDLADEIAQRPMAPPQAETSDLEDWLANWRAWEGKTWRQVAWYFAEAFFYRRLLETVGYFKPGEKGQQDPFAAQKAQALVQGLDALGRFLAQPEPADAHGQFERWLLRSLWGNRVDLSNTVTASAGQHDLAYGEAEWLLVDGSQQVWEALANGKARRLDLIADNSGLELLSDLGMLAWLLRSGLTQTVVLHLKRHPFFVSDARIADLRLTLDALRQSAQAELRRLGDELDQAQGQGQLIVQDHLFWNSPWSFSALPQDLLDALAVSNLLVFKGDANYRRLVEDRHWPPETPLGQCTSYLPQPFVALRTLKSELILGLEPGQAEDMALRDPQWLLNGRWGVIDWVEPQTWTASFAKMFKTGA